MSTTECERRVESILRGLRGMKPLQELFWRELNYERVAEPLSRRNWPGDAATSLAEDPQLFAAGGEDNRFHVIYNRLASDSLPLAAERPVVSRLLRDHQHALFIFSNRQQDRWHFLNVKYDESLDRRRLFRRITVGASERLHTACQRLSMLDLETIKAHDPLGIQSQHDKAFDVEEVSDEFFRQYREVFEHVEGEVTGIRDKDRRRLFTQRLFNRLMFVAFVQKKGWLRLKGSTDYLAALWHAHEAENSKTRRFYRDRLKMLFFEALSHPSDNPSQAAWLIEDFVGDVPYLNGGLFEKSEDGTDDAENVFVPDACFPSIIGNSGLFGRFNFTVVESTPLDVEVAVDPEMLGRVFEELVTGRHETGSYYTPKPVVSFKCRKALKGYLATAVPGETQDGIERFVEQHDPSGLHNAEGILDALRRIKVCDPACGSGAYLLGMLHELFELRDCLFKTSQKLDPLSAYNRKLEIIQNNLYGVDLDEFAVNIARLRLWLSLAVDHEGDKPEPLPNLDFKIERGDSLTARSPEAVDQLVVQDKLVADYQKAKDDYLMSHGEAKRLLRQEVMALKEQVGIWARSKHAPLGFDWPVEFAEVFVRRGFDVIIANPPYVRADAQFKHIVSDGRRQEEIARWKVYRAKLVESGVYKTLYEKWDLYVPFLERAHQLLRPGGQMVYIIPDAYNAAKYAKKSHEFFLEHARIERIDFCSDIPLFDAGVSNTILHFAKFPPNAAHVPVRVRRWGKTRDEFDVNTEVLASRPQVESGAEMFKPDATNQAATPKGFVSLGHICYISKGMVIHADEREWQGVFTTDDVLSSSRDARHPRRFVLGKDVDKWALRNVRFLEWGTKRAPRQFSRPTFPELHGSKEKLVAVRTPGAEPKVTYDDDCLHYDASSVGFVPWHLLHGVRNKSIKKTAKYRNEVIAAAQRPPVVREQLEETSRKFELKYLLAVMNSGHTKSWLATRRRSKVHIYPDDWKQLPIAPIPKGEQQEFVKLVDAILAEFKKHGYPLPPASAARVAELEHEIDARVKTLYGT